MFLTKGNITIRNAVQQDAATVCNWWNDGNVMAIAGFPNGLGTTVEKVAAQIAEYTCEKSRLHIMEVDGKPIGELHYRNTGNGVAQIGIKICDTTQQERGYGTTILQMFIDALFTYYGYRKIILDANLKNKRAQHVYEKKLGFTMLQINENAWRDQLGQMQGAIDYELCKENWHINIDYVRIRVEQEADHYTTEEITREAHWEGNWDIEPCITDTHLLVHKLRQCPSYVPELHFIAEMDGKVVGHIVYATSKIVDENGKEHGMLTFGPLSVLPDYQSRGIGKALIRHSFREAKLLGYRAVLIFGHPDYYPRVGFQPAANFKITTAEGKNADPFMAYPLYEGALDGVHGRYHIDPVYEDSPSEEVIEFDKKFPPKELHIPVPITILLDRLPAPAQKALDGLKHRSLKVMTTKSEREILALDGTDADTVEIIRVVMHENGLEWGKV